MLNESLFNTDEILEGLKPWVLVESPTSHVAGVNKMMDLVSADLARLGATIERTPGAPGYGDIVIGRFPGREPTNSAGILILSHLDTVHLVGTLEGRLPLRRDGDRYFGPGIYDMKGGVRIAVHALNVLAQTGQVPALPVTYMLIPDEEVGSPTSREMIEAEARRHKYVLVTEPCKSGVIVTGRYAFQRYWVTVTGRPAHAGANNRQGRSAIRAMARLIERIENMTDFDRGMTFSVGTISGGTFVNVMPIECRAQVLTVAPTAAIFDEVAACMQSLESEDDGIRVTVERGPFRPLWHPHRETMALFERAHGLAADIGFELRHGSFGGGSDGNFTGALGIATLDGLGVDGAGAHTFEEHLLVSSLVPRCRLFAELLASLH
ncbi:MAG: M20/M25/M40 family metallo-hydrolase [Hyphomicrobiaceae bacterium]